MGILSFLIGLSFAAGLSLEGVDTIEVEGKNLDLQVQESPGKNLEWSSSEQGVWDVKQEGTKLSFKSDTNEKTRLVIKSPAKPLRFFANQGSLDVNTWLAPAYIRGLSLQVKSQKTSGLWDIHSQSGLVKIKDHQGDVIVDLGEGKLNLDQVKGNLNLEQFAGEVEIKNVEGDIELITQKANTKLFASSGSLNYESLNGEIVLNDFSGSLRGKSQNGKSVLRPLANSKVYWRAEEGGLRLGLKKMNGAYVDVATKKGHLSLVPPLKAKDEGIWRVARAKLRGSEPGSVKIRTNNADIKLQFD